MRLAVSGEVERANVKILIERLRAVEQTGPRSLTVDLEECSFVDRVGACVLIDAGRRARREGRRVAVINPPPGASRLFQLIALHRSVDIEERPPSKDATAHALEREFERDH